MRVTRLEIFGFKSFVERFVLNFDKNIIGIVGPNGCGKSNIVDALRWVLGETHAKQLRGNSLEDLIFNGSESRRPLGMAEVSLTIRPNEGWMMPLTTAKSEQPTEGQASEGEAEANGHLNGTVAMEAKSEAPEQQGENAQAENSSALNGHAENQSAESRSAESRAAAGSQSGENNNGTSETGAAALDIPLVEIDTAEIAALALESEEETPSLVPQALLEIPGLFDAAEIQLTRRLYRSGESEYFINRIPCRLRDMVDIYRLIGLGSRGLSIVQQGQIGQLISKKPVERRELLEEAAGISGFRARMETAQRKLDRTSENMARLNDIIAEVDKQVRSLKRQAARARARNELKAGIRTTELELFSLRSAQFLAKKTELAAKNAGLLEKFQHDEAQLRGAEAEEEELRAAMQELDTQLVSLRRSRDEVYQILVREREQAQERRIELARAESRVRSLNEQLQRLAQRDAAIEEEAAQRRERLPELEAQLGNAEEQRRLREEEVAAVQERARQQEAMEPTGQEAEPVESELAVQIRTLSQELEQLGPLSERLREEENRLSTSRRELHQAEQQLNKERVKHAALQSEISSLEKQIDALAEHAAKSFSAADGENLKGSLEHLRGEGLIDRVLSAGIRVPEALQRPLAAVLGERGSYVLSSNPEALARSYRLQDHAKVGVIARDPQRSGGIEPLSQEELEAAPAAAPLLSLLEMDDDVRPALESLVGEVIYVATLAEAAALNARNRELGRPLRTLVTEKGEVVTPWGWYTTQAQGLGFSFTRRIEELRERLSESEAQLSAAEASNEARRREQEEIRTAAAALSAERERLIQQQKRLADLHRQEKEAERRRRQAEAEAARKRREAHLQEERAAQRQLHAAVAELAGARSRLESEERRIKSLEDDLRQTAAQEERLREEIAAAEGAQEQIREQIKLAETGEAQAEVRSGTERFEQLEQRIRQVDEERQQLSSTLAEVAQRHAEHRRECERLNRERNNLELALEKIDIERRMLRESAARRYPEEDALPSEEHLGTLAESLDPAVGENISALEAELDKLERRLEREGEVDPQSIELYETEQARLLAMQANLADLEAATKILEKTIRQLKDISRRRFIETFDDVSKKFAELVPRLFGGGAGQLELVNPDDPLNSGVEMSVRPPGKRITTMELMSGGEKALVATAVLIAMFLHRPSPICVLDEVDAPLDDANLDRYLMVIKEISEKTQFLIITHNKTTMAAVDRLLGITMQESGVSTALSVTVEEAEAALLAANA